MMWRKEQMSEERGTSGAFSEYSSTLPIGRRSSRSKVVTKLAGLITIGAALLCSAVAQADVIPKIMPLGDSITSGQQEDSARAGSYRTTLYDLLDRNGYQVDFVGSMRTPIPFDRDNEGHGGWRASHLSGDETPPFGQTGNITQWLPQHKPDIILCMAGANDFFSGMGDQAAASNIQRLINKCFQYAPDARIIVGSITNSSTLSNIRNINSMTKTFVENLASQGKKISYLDMYTPLDRATDMSSDGIHPSVSGYSKLANVWYSELIKYIKKPDGTGSPYGAKAWKVPGRVQAENYDFGPNNTAYYDTTASGNAGGLYRNGFVDIGASSEGGHFVGWTAAGEWLTYTVDVTTAGNHTLTIRYAGTGNGAVQLSFGGVDKTGTVSLPSTGDWNNWTDKTVTVNLAAGIQVMRLNIVNSGFNLNYLTFDGPTGVKATPGDGRVSLTWNAVPGAARYRVKRSTTNGSGYSWVVSDWGSTNYTNTGLNNGTTYYYVIASQDANGNEMADSSQVIAVPSASPQITNLASNPGFEAEQFSTQTPSGWGEWSSAGGTNSGYTGNSGGAYAGNYHGIHYNTSAYNMYTSQTKTGLANGLYTLRAMVKSSGGQHSCRLEAKDYGSLASTPITASSQWVSVVVSNINVTNGQCMIGIWSNANAGNWVYFDNVEFFKQ